MDCTRWLGLGDERRGEEAAACRQKECPSVHRGPPAGRGLWEEQGGAAASGSNLHQGGGRAAYDQRSTFRLLPRVRPRGTSAPGKMTADPTLTYRSPQSSQVPRSRHLSAPPGICRPQAGQGRVRRTRGPTMPMRRSSHILSPADRGRGLATALSLGRFEGPRAAGPRCPSQASPPALGVTPHDLRRSAIRNLVISGHRSRAVFDRYDITSQEDQQRAIARLDQYMEAGGHRGVHGGAARG